MIQSNAEFQIELSAAALLFRCPSCSVPAGTECRAKRVGTHVTRKDRVISAYNYGWPKGITAPKRFRTPE